uniref:FH2 domain-containing protein n=1 Tax=Lactuca sativa TaxID=4236 RepID=A0A9R1UI22_LACSA|nr:hypothetical protein LSAT_V11C900502300 [Lactuca sativa]
MCLIVCIFSRKSGIQVLDEFQKYTWPVPVDQKALRFTGTTLTITSHLLGKWWIWNCLQGSVRFREGKIFKTVSFIFSMGRTLATINIDISELENLFSAAIPPNKNAAKSKSAPIANIPEKVQLIDHRRAYNCEIMLSKVNIPLHELMFRIQAMSNV